MATVLCNGIPATTEDLATLALINHGHFTTLQVRAGAALGVDLHLRRLQEATMALFGTDLDPERVLADIRIALNAARSEDATVRATVFARSSSPVAIGGEEHEVDLLVSVGAAGQVGEAPLRVKSVGFVRALPQYKHVGISPSQYAKSLATRHGYDDAAFVDGAGHVVEGTFWNIGIWDGERILWPQGAALRGTRERLLQSGLDRLGVPQRTDVVGLEDFGRHWAAFTCNSRGQQRIAAIDDRELAEAPELLPLLERAMATHAWERL